MERNNLINIIEALKKPLSCNTLQRKFKNNNVDTVLKARPHKLQEPTEVFSEWH